MFRSIFARITPRTALLTCISLSLATGVGCGPSDAGSGDNNDEVLCVQGEPHPITGECVVTGDDMGGEGSPDAGMPLDDAGGDPTGDAGGQAGDDMGGATGTCPDETYSASSESLMPQADLSAQQSGYDESQYTTVALEVLEARYPLGAKLVEEGRASDRFMQDCLLAFSQGRRSTFRDAMLGLSTVVHECGHMTDIDRSFDKGFGTVVYVVRPDLVVELPKLDTFHRSEIRQYTGDDDSYASTYLEGQSGMQGFDTLMEEFVQYVNSLMTGYVFAEFYQGGQRSERDGILTFMMYLEYYLKHARANHPQVYGRISGNAEWREFILMMWGRAELALSLTEGMQQLGIDDDAIEQRVRSQELAAEIERLRELHDCR